MAITKERLEELIEQKAKIYGISKNNNVFCVGLKLKNQAMCLLNPNNYKKTDWYKKQIEVYSKFYETKEEAEFVQKFHTSKTVYFEPPTWEEFLKMKSKWSNVIAIWGCKTIEIALHCLEESRIVVNNDNYEQIKIFNYTKENGIDNRKQKYYEAVEYAKKLFLGEEE